jgi:methylated-DNA-[protein]-cysteine S-methyltransferase
VNCISIQYYKSPIGELVLGSFNDELVLSDWRYRKMRASIDNRIQKELKLEFKEKESEIIDITILQLTEYFNKERTKFDIPLKMIGTDFQKSVWEKLLKIQYGKTDTYLGLSKKLGNEKAIRAVATANGANAISILIPCHRVIGSDNSLVGYAGGIIAKKKILELENPNLISNQTRLF